MTRLDPYCQASASASASEQTDRLWILWLGEDRWPLSGQSVRYLKVRRCVCWIHDLALVLRTSTVVQFGLWTYVAEQCGLGMKPFALYLLQYWRPGCVSRSDWSMAN